MSLTFDDGPGERLTPSILDMLAAAGAHATFFLLGLRAERLPEMPGRIRRGGHELGCHTRNHRHAWKSFPWTSAADIEAGYRTLAPWVRPDGLFRPPYGKLTPFTWLSLRRRGAPIGWWTIDSGDTHHGLPTPRSVADQVCRDGGGVVLLHDFDRESRDADARHRFVLATTELLLRTAAREGISVKRLGEIMGLGGMTGAGPGRMADGR